MTSARSYYKNGVIIVLMIVGVLFLPASELNDSTLARYYSLAAKEHYSRSNFDSAITYYRLAGEMWQKYSPMEYVNARIGLANSLVRRGEYQTVIHLLIETDSIGSMYGYSNSVEQGSLYNLLGYCYVTNEEFANGERYVNRGIEILIKIFGNHHEKVGSALYTLGLVQKKRGLYLDAISSLNRVIQIQTSQTSPVPQHIANTMMLLGTVYDDMNEFEQAIRYFLYADSIYRSTGLDGSADAGSCYLQLMSSYHNKGDYVSAIKTGLKVIETYSRLNLPNHHNIASAELKMGEIYISIGDVEKAKDYLMRSLDLFSVHHSNKRSAIGKIYIHLGDVFNKSGDKKKAVHYAGEGIEIYERAVGELYPQIGFMYEIVAGIYAEAHNLDKAVMYYTKALNARRLVGDSRSRSDLSMLYSSLGYVLLNQGKIDSSVFNMRKAWSIDSAASEINIPQRAVLLQRFGQLNERQNQFSMAIEYYHKAVQTLTQSEIENDVRLLPRIENVVYKRELLDLLMAKANLFEKRAHGRQGLDDLKSAFEHYSKAMDVLDEMRKGYSSELSKLNLAKQGSIVYRSGCRIALRLYEKSKDPLYKEEAFLIADRSKGNVLLERLFENDARQFSGIPDSMIQQEHALLSELSRLETKFLHTQESMIQPGSSAITNDQSHYYHMKQQHRSFVEMLEREFPRYYDLKYGRSVLTIKKIQEQLREGTVMIEYMVDTPSIYVFVITRNALEIRTLKNTEKIRSLARKFNSSLKTYDTQEFCRVGFDLYSSIFLPLKSFMVGAEELLIIPDGFLHYIPFEALPTQRYREQYAEFTSIHYVISQYVVRYAYSAAFVDKLNQNAGSVPSSFVGFAPVFKDSIHNSDFFAHREAVKQSGLADTRSITIDGKTFNELRFSENEIVDIERTFSQKNVNAKTFIFESATEENFKRYAQQYDIVHIATHGFINEAQPKFSAIVFSQPQSTSGPEDGILYVHETFTLNLKAKLVVLSSCESGIGQLVDGEGMIALSRGLFYAGAQNLVFSLWKVSDKQTYHLMNKFYTSVSAGKSFASSLRSAKLAMIKSRDTAFPAKWSGFVLVGQ